LIAAEFGLDKKAEIATRNSTGFRIGFAEAEARYRQC
jgi:hypothetical protein